VVGQCIAVSSAVPLAIFISLLGELPLNGDKAFRREGIGGNTRISPQQSSDGGAEGVIMGGVIFLDMVQKGNGH
jgi:hypothetical protein